MNKNLFIEICNNYKGDFKEEENEIIFYSYNSLIHSENVLTDDNEIKFITKERKVYCELSYNYETHIFKGEEETLEIIGGFSYPASRNIKEEDIIRALERYNFKQKDYVQLTLF